ncbi:MAG: hypothetical protein Q9175_008268, partial [Cornicularia normoerica]
HMEKNAPSTEKAIATTVIGTPARPSLNGPQGKSESGVVRRLFSITEAERMNEE